MLDVLDREAREMAWELQIMEDWGCQETEKYKRLRARFFTIVNTARKMRCIPPMDDKEYEQIQLARVLHGNRHSSGNKSNM